MNNATFTVTSKIHGTKCDRLSADLLVRAVAVTYLAPNEANRTMVLTLQKNQTGLQQHASK